MRNFFVNGSWKFRFQFGLICGKEKYCKIYLLWKRPWIYTDSEFFFFFISGKKYFGILTNFFQNCSTKFPFYISIVKSIRSISQKSKFYWREVSKFLYTMRNKCGMFCSLYWEYELKILCLSVKLAYLGIYFTEKHARLWVTWLTVLLRL